MVGQILAPIAFLLRTFAADDTGNVAAIFTLALLPFVSAVGAAVHFSHANSVKSGLQAAVDATTLMAAKDAANTTIEQVQQKAADYFKAQFKRVDVSDVQVAVNLDGATPPTVKVTGSVQMATDFMGVMGFPTMKIVARAAALATFGNDGCVLALNAQASGAATAQGTPDVALKGCSLYDNSGSNTALTVGGAARITALSVNVFGLLLINGVARATIST
jgi:Flp pilus assembly protein TadG